MATEWKRRDNNNSLTCTAVGGGRDGRSYYFGETVEQLGMSPVGERAGKCRCLRSSWVPLMPTLQLRTGDWPNATIAVGSYRQLLPAVHTRPERSMTGSVCPWRAAIRVVMAITRRHDDHRRRQRRLVRDLAEPICFWNEFFPPPGGGPQFESVNYYPPPSSTVARTTTCGTADNSVQFAPICCGWTGAGTV